MKIRGSLALVATLAACATGGQTEFRTGAMGPVENGVACVAEEVREAGWNVTRSDDAGFIRAEMAAHWLEAQLIPGERNASHVVEVRVADTDESRDTAEDVLANCS